MDHAKAFPLTTLPVHDEPFDFILKEDFIRLDVYAELERSFLTCPPSTGPTGFSYYWGDAEYNNLISHNWAWKEFFETAHSQRFVDYCREQFARAYRIHRCSIRSRESGLRPVARKP